MAISILAGANSVQAASSTSLALGTGNAAGDLHLCGLQVKSITNDVAVTPAGYTDIVLQTTSGHTWGKWFGKFLVGGDSAPSVSGPGGVSQMCTYLTLRGCRVGTVTDAIEFALYGLNASATTINYSAATITTAGVQLILQGIYNTSGAGTLGTPTTLSGGATNTVAPYTGTNMKSTLWTDLQTSASSITAGNIPITSGSTQTNRFFFLGVRPAVSSTVTISDIGDELFYSGETGITITGTAFGASQGAGFVKISPTNNINDVNAVTQTITSWSNTSIQFTAIFGSLAYFTTLYVFVQNNSSQSNATGYQVKRQARGRISETIKVNNSGVVTVYANQTGLEYRVSKTISGATVQSNTDATTDAAGLCTLPYFNLTEGGSVAVGDDLYLAIGKDDATKSSTRTALIKVTPTYS